MRTRDGHSEKREFGRRRTGLSGWVTAPGRAPMACRVLNISEGGALLGFAVPPALPKRFALKIDTGSLQLQCEVRHVNGTNVGVEFVVARETRPVDQRAVRALEQFAREIPWGRDSY